ncbi:histone acetyltransferase type B catalytic subunit-like [Corticium candelabrum]|uniref:histone acetyltransferase type B catalytic subunit-like n=1 Tax=Corticium candelabrum TaxID=121492 RepID=UPI002E265126|nr:histone acetyltransferase type B catalytic subunit-like [Corticium candelabrum]
MEETKAAVFVAPANENIFIRLVSTSSEVLQLQDEDSLVFHPEYTHQLFGENECIFGYKQPRVDLWYGASTLTTYFHFGYNEKGSEADLEGAQIDFVEDIIGDKLAPGYLNNKEEFLARLERETSFRPFGELVHVYTSNEDDRECPYEVYKGDILTPGLRDYHARLQTFILWFIDAASFIDVDDENWQFYFLFERKTVDGQPMYCIVGYATVYKYYAFPDKTRPRISQFLILPTFQRRGHGAQLLQIIYNQYVGDQRVLDITVEDPSDEFTGLRDYVDAGNCSRLSSFQPSAMKSGFSQEMALQAQKQLKINKQQARKVYEILRLRATDRSNPVEYKDYRLAVKRRLNKPFQKEQSDLKKLERVLNPDELAATIASTGLEERHQKLNTLYEITEQSYLRTVEKLASM